ncbi:MAG: hypothetical protein ACI94Y_003027 [Maribacter sp.]|jgi:hypothetical protein
METFKELFDVFAAVIQEEKINVQPNLFTKHRGTKDSITDEIETIGFNCSKIVSSQTNMRFSNAVPVLEKRLIRISFMAS